MLKKFINKKRLYTGTLLVVDESLNMVIDETTEYRKYKNKKRYEIRKLGIAVFRGSKIMNLKRLEEEKNEQ